VNVPNNVIDVLTEHGVQGKDIDTIVWSHHHFD
jgi:glyoxylase-like metal-dependent hydrolase (beta-lactamase superfamily II)